MVATWREVVEIAANEFPSARYFAWASDHDRWHPRWLERLLAEIDRDPSAVLAYPITRRIDEQGTELDKGPRLFDTSACDSLGERWRHMCHEGIGAGDMVYGLMRLDALRKAGIFRRVLRPDRLLIAELSLYGRFRQVAEVLWFRRESALRAWIVSATPWCWRRRAARVRRAAMARSTRACCGGSARPRGAAAGDFARHLGAHAGALPAHFQCWRHFRKTEASHAIGRGIDQTI
jgi:hypothetical protein